MYETSIPYTDEAVEQAIFEVQQFQADYGGTQIAEPLLDIVKVDKTMEKYDRNIILLTDGQVHNTEVVIEIIKQMKQKNVGTTHMVGVGDGVSFDLIRKGALRGGGEHLFIMKND